MGVGCVDPDVSDAATVLLERSCHDLGLLADLPDAHFTFHTAGDDTLAIVSWRQSCNAVVMSIVNGVEKSA